MSHTRFRKSIKDQLQNQAWVSVQIVGKAQEMYWLQFVFFILL